MKKKIVILTICFIACIHVFAQSVQNIFGEYKFFQIELTATDYFTKNPVITQIFADSLQAMTQNWNFPLLPVFSKVIIANGQITECTLLNNGNSYMIAGDNLMVRLATRHEGLPDEYANDYYLPRYSVAEQGSSITITFDKMIYGCSNYPNQTLVGIYKLTLVKQ